MNCLNCQATVTNGVALCAQCRQTLGVALVNVGAYFADVDRIRPGDRVKVRSTFRSAPPPGVEPARDSISAVLDLTATQVFTWCQSLMDDRPVGEMPVTTERRCGWLESHVPSIVTLEWAAECLRQMHECERNLRDILDRADTGWYAGVCGNEIGREMTEDGLSVPVTCERHLYGTQGSSWVRCPECGRTWDAGARRDAMMREARDQHAPVSVIASAVVGLVDGEHSVQRLANRIDQWVHRDKLQSLGVRVLADGRPHRVYRLGDVFDLMGLEVLPQEPEAC